MIDANWIHPSRVVVLNGLRSVGGPELQLLCPAGEYDLDIVVREPRSSAEMEMVGQITQGGRAHEPVAGLHVHLLDAKSECKVATTCTDQFGEFHLSVPKQSRYGLRLGSALDAPCVLVWQGELA